MSVLINQHCEAKYEKLILSMFLEYSRFMWDTVVYYCVYEIPSLHPILSRVRTFHIRTPIVSILSFQFFCLLPFAVLFAYKNEYKKLINYLLC
jgi:hypothetical protein